MKLYIEVLKFIFRKFVLRQNTGTALKKLCTRMGIVYIKFAQILATQNYGNLFTEADREMLSSICDNCNPIPFRKIEQAIKKEYGDKYDQIFASIDPKPVGSASISQVHRAMLVTGEDVAIKVKRQDVAEGIDRELKRLSRLVHRFGKFVQFANFSGGDRALDLFLSWIKQETDFIKEQQNIVTYQKFADSVNDKVPDTKNVRVPKLYKEYCTENIIVMEFIHHKTINRLELNPENCKKISDALNSYLQASFFAMYHDQPVIFHGDPHSGNIYIDENGNIGFLDMGLLFELSEEDVSLTRTFFLAAYSGNYEKLYNLLIPYYSAEENRKFAFKEECRRYCTEVKNKDVSCYFTDMMNVCLKYEFVPPNFLFCMAKAFVCLNGINNFSHNQTSAIELLQEQTLEFLLRRSAKDCINLIGDRLTAIPRLAENTLSYGFLGAIAKETVRSSSFRKELKNSLENVQETLDLINLSY